MASRSRRALNWYGDCSRMSGVRRKRSGSAALRAYGGQRGAASCRPPGDPTSEIGRSASIMTQRPTREEQASRWSARGGRGGQAEPGYGGGAVAAGGVAGDDARAGRGSSAGGVWGAGSALVAGQYGVHGG